MKNWAEQMVYSKTVKRTLTLSIASLLTLLMLNGCAAYVDDLFNWDQRYYDLNGKSVNTVLSLMGLPDNTYELGSNKVYIWVNTDTSLDYVGKRKHDESAYEYLSRSGTITSRCEIKMLINSNERVSRVEITGSQGSCVPSKWEGVLRLRKETRGD